MFAKLRGLNKIHQPYFLWDSTKPPLSYLYLMIGIYLLVAWFSEGYSRPDEHYQILELAAYHIYHYPYLYPWELSAHIRPTFQIWVVIGLYKMATFLSWQISPFMLAFLTRFLTGCFSALSYYLFVSAFQHQLNSNNKRKYFFLLSAFGFMALFYVVRFSSESVSAIFFLCGFSLIFYPVISRQSLIYFIAGVFLGLSFITRYQLGLMIFGLIAWLVVYKQIQAQKFVLMLVGIVMVVGLGIYLDSLFYGKLTYTAWRYFEANILQDKVSSFGTSSCWTYLSVAFIFPYGPLFLLSSLYFVTHCPKHVITWVLVPFIMVHCLIGHKELRFLIPILGLMPFVLIYSFQCLQTKYQGQFTGDRLAQFKKPIWILNGLVVLYVVFIGHADFRIYKYIWTHYNHSPVFLNYIKKGDTSPDNSLELTMPLRFYVPQSLYIHKDEHVNHLLCQNNAACLVWVSCSEKKIKDNPNLKFLYDSCFFYDAIKAYLKGGRWMDRSILFRYNGRLYDYSIKPDLSNRRW